jgi:hypothetical protein
MLVSLLYNIDCPNGGLGTDASPAQMPDPDPDPGGAGPQDQRQAAGMTDAAKMWPDSIRGILGPEDSTR